MTSTIICSIASAPNYRVAVYGTRGLAETERDLDAFRFVPVPDKPGGAPASQPEVIENKGFNPVKACIEAFAAAASGGPEFPITTDQIIHGVAVFEAVVKSASTGQPAKVAQLQ